MSAAVVAAVVARIKAGATGQGVTAYDAQPANPSYPYCIVYADAGVGSADRECDSITSREVGWQTTVVGVSAAQVRAATDRVVAALEGWRPAVTGRSCSLVMHDGSQPVRADETLADRSLFIATDQWRVASSPA